MPIQKATKYFLQKTLFVLMQYNKTFNKHNRKPLGMVLQYASTMKKTFLLKIQDLLPQRIHDRKN